MNGIPDPSQAGVSHAYDEKQSTDRPKARTRAENPNGFLGRRKHGAVMIAKAKPRRKTVFTDATGENPEAWKMRRKVSERGYRFMLVDDTARIAGVSGWVANRIMYDYAEARDRLGFDAPEEAVIAETKRLGSSNVSIETVARVIGVSYYLNFYARGETSSLGELLADEAAAVISGVNYK